MRKQPSCLLPAEMGTGNSAPGHFGAVLRGREELSSGNPFSGPKSLLCTQPSISWPAVISHFLPRSPEHPSSPPASGSSREIHLGLSLAVFYSINTHLYILIACILIASPPHMINAKLTEPIQGEKNNKGLVIKLAFSNVFLLTETPGLQELISQCRGLKAFRSCTPYQFGKS